MTPVIATPVTVNVGLCSKNAEVFFRIKVVVSNTFFVHPGEMIQFDLSIFSRWAGSTTN